MGCDIHLYVEYGDDEQEQLFSLTKSEFYVVRNYDLFSALAGIRRTRPPLHEPRGIPERLSGDAHAGYWLFISEEPHPIARTATREEARRSVDAGHSIRKQRGKLAWVSDPEWHDASWLTRDETRAALARHDLRPEELQPEFRIVLFALDELRDRNPRIVFWFDG